jgi:hypothetical protein
MTRHSNRSAVAAASVPAIFFSLFAILPFAAYFGNAVAHSRPAMSIDLSPAADASHSIIR